MRTLILLICLLLGISNATPSKEACRIIIGCGLTQISECHNQKPLSNEQCVEARELHKRGLSPKSPMNHDVYDFLGHDLRIVYDVEQELVIRPSQLEFMLNDLPLATRIINYFQMTPYMFEYTGLDHSQFNLAKGEEAKGSARVISGSPNEGIVYYYGIGTVRMGLLSAKGPALVKFTYSPIPGKPHLVRCNMRIVIVLNNRLLGGFLNMGIVRNMIVGKIHGVMSDISESAIASNNTEKLLEGPWSPDELEQIRKFIFLP